MRRYLAVAPVVLALAAFAVPAAEAAPSAVTGSATSVGTTGVTLNGMVDPGGVDTAWFFELAPVGQTAKLDTETVVISGTGAQPVSVAVAGLAPGTSYTYSLVAIDADGAGSEGAAAIFSTTGPTPLATGVTQVSGSTAVLNGVLPASSASGTSYGFEYGPTSAYGFKTTIFRTSPGAQLQTVSARVRGLASGTVYHYRLVLQGGTIASADATFATAGAALPATPGIVALPADGVDGSSALLQASFPAGQAGTYQFEYGTTSSYGVLTEPMPLLQEMTAATAGVADLLPSQTYHYRLLLSTAQGVLASGDMTFITLGDTTQPTVSLGHPSCKASRACTLGGSAADDALASVDVSVVLKTGRTCRAFTGTRFVKRSCSAAAKTFVEAWTSGGKWMLQLPALTAGTYQVAVRASDRAGNTKRATASVRVKG